MDAILTFDVGTTAVKTCLFDGGFRMLASVTSEYALERPEPGRVELNPEVYWREICRGTAQVLAESSIDSASVAVITATTQGETLIPADASGNPLGHVIVWLDERAREEADMLRQIIPGALYRHSTGLPGITPTDPLCKLMWLKRNAPALYARAEKFLLLEDWLLCRMTGGFATNPSLMSSTGYFDIRHNAIWDEALREAGLERSKFSDVLPCGTIAGTLTREAAKALGLAPGTPVSTGAMDQVASAVGAGNVLPGIVTETTGTALVAAATALSPDVLEGSSVTAYRHYDEQYLLLDFYPESGIILKWFKDEFCSGEAALGPGAYAALDALAAAVPPGAGGLTLRPRNASGAIAFEGIRLGMGRAHFVRAILEGTACLLRESLCALEAAGASTREIRSLGGGAASPLWCQIKADITGRRLVTMRQRQSTSLGAAILGAVAVGMAKNVTKACKTAVEAERTYQPAEGLQ